MFLNVAYLVTILLNEVLVGPGEDSNRGRTDAFELLYFLVDLHLPAGVSRGDLRVHVVVHHF